MADCELKARISQEMKDALRAGQKQRLGALRLMLSEIKRVEVDERVELDDPRVLAILDKMAKQRRDSMAQYEKANRQDLVDQERFELDLLATFMPRQLSAEEISALIEESLAATGATSMRDMGKLMGELRPKVQGRADMTQISAMVKARLT